MAEPLRLLAILLGCLILCAPAGTYAGWVDTVEVPGTEIATGSVDLTVGGAQQLTGWTALDADGLFPGTSTAAVLTVGNEGVSPLRYGLGASATGALAAALRVRVTAGPVTGAAPYETCTGAVLTSGAVLGPDLVPATRLLPGGASELLCVEVGLPAGAASSLQGTEAEVTWTLTAAQGGWSDTATVTGTRLAALMPQPPVVSCAPLDLLRVRMTWPAVPGATGYRLHLGPGGSVTEEVGPATLSRTFLVADGGTFTARSRYGDWVSEPSAPRSYAMLAVAACG